MQGLRIRYNGFVNIRIHESWKEKLSKEFGQEYFVKLTEFVKKEYKIKSVFPAAENIFRAFDLCPFDKVKVVIIGQDPYHGKGQAHGLCFSVNDGIAIPPSLQNIYKEIESDLGIKVQKDTGNLERWARQGVLLLNATLTVEAAKAGSHQNQGWENFTDSAISALSQNREHIVFLLWGKYAQDKSPLIDETKHFILRAAHPSPFSAYNGFFGCKHFSKTNEYLQFFGEEPINWS